MQCRSGTGGIICPARIPCFLESINQWRPLPDKHSRAGIAEMLVLHVMEETMIKRGVTGELSMTLEDNFMVNRFLEAIGADRYKTWRIYSKSVARSRF